MSNCPPFSTPCLVLAGILLKVNKYQFLIFVKYVVIFVWWQHMPNTHTQPIYLLLKCQNTQKSRLICFFLLVEVTSVMMVNVLVKFGDTGYSFNFNMNFEVLKVTPDSVHGGGPFSSPLQRHKHVEKTQESNKYQVSPEISIFLKWFVVWSSHLGVKIRWKFSFSQRPHHGCTMWNHPFLLSWHLVCFALVVYGRSFRTNLAYRFYVLKLQRVPSVCRQWWFKVSDTIKYSPSITQTAFHVSSLDIYLRVTCITSWRELNWGWQISNKAH